MAGTDKSFTELMEFVRGEMNMTRWYQPAVIRALADANGVATFRSLALAVMPQDEQFVRDAEDIIKRWPKQTLVKHGLIEVTGPTVRLRVKPMTLAQRAELRAACDARLQDHWRKYGLPVAGAVSSTLRYTLIKTAGGRCQACGRKDSPLGILDIDHIKPKKKSGKTVEGNLQVLCHQCNRGKRDTDDTDFRRAAGKRKVGCAFCESVEEAPERNREGFVAAIPDSFPSQMGTT